MITLMLVAIVGQGMFGTPPASPAPPVDRSAAIIQRLADDRHESQQELAKLTAEVSALKDALAKLAAQPAAPPQIIREPALPPALPPAPQRVYVARDVSGFDWEDTDQARLMNWVELRNTKASGTRKVIRASEVAPAPAERTYTMPTTVLPAAPPPPLIVYTPAMVSTWSRSPLSRGSVCTSAGFSQ